MDAESSARRVSVRYQPDENPPTVLAFGLGLQLAILCISGIVLTPAIVARAAGGTEAFLSWIVFAAVAVSGVTTVLQAVRVGRIGAGYTLAMGPSGAFIAICITAIAEGGPAMLATLVILSSFFQFALSARLSLFRRVLTPAVAGTVIMLVPVTIMPIIFGLLTSVPEGTPMSAAALSAGATLLAIGGIALKATGILRLWAPVIGVAFGSVVAGHFGLYEVSRVAEASWLGFPEVGWPGYDFSFGPVFWTLVPAFVFVTLVGAVGNRRRLRRHPACRLATPPGSGFPCSTGHSGSGWSRQPIVRSLGDCTEHDLFDQCFRCRTDRSRSPQGRGCPWTGFPRFGILPQGACHHSGNTWPGCRSVHWRSAVVAFVVGMKVAIQDGIDYRTGLIVGISFWIGVGSRTDGSIPNMFPNSQAAF